MTSCSASGARVLLYRMDSRFTRVYNGTSKLDSVLLRKARASIGLLPRYACFLATVSALKLIIRQ